MTGDGVDEMADAMVRRAIGGDVEAIARIAAQVEETADPTVLVMAALLAADLALLDHAATLATSRRDRQQVAIARAQLCGDVELVDALARDHLVDFPDGYVVAWIASGAVTRTTGPAPR
jgi:hypothetical protein